MFNPGLARLYIYLANGKELKFIIYEDTFYEDDENGRLHFTVYTEERVEADAVFHIYQLAGYALS